MLDKLSILAAWQSKGPRSQDIWGLVSNTLLVSGLFTQVLVQQMSKNLHKVLDKLEKISEEDDIIGSYEDSDSSDWELYEFQVGNGSQALATNLCMCASLYIQISHMNNPIPTELMLYQYTKRPLLLTMAVLSIVVSVIQIYMTHMTLALSCIMELDRVDHQPR